jgi:Ca2+/Na+ antiporter
MDSLKSKLEYIPIVLLSLLFIADKDAEIHALNVSCQVIITIVILGIFFMLMLQFGRGKIVSFLIAATAWVVLTNAKKSYFPQPIQK